MPLYYSSIQPISSDPAFSVVPSHPVFPSSALPRFPPALWSPDRLGSDVPSAPQSSINTGIVPVYALSGTVSATFRIYHMSVLPHSLPDPAGNSLHAVCNMNMQLEDFYNGAIDADYLIYNSAIDGGVKNLNELLDKCPVLADFRAVKDGNVFCTTNDMYQQSMSIGYMIDDMHSMITVMLYGLLLYLLCQMQ